MCTTASTLHHVQAGSGLMQEGQSQFDVCHMHTLSPQSSSGAHALGNLTKQTRLGHRHDRQGDAVREVWETDGRCRELPWLHTALTVQIEETPLAVNKITAKKGTIRDKGH